MISEERFKQLADEKATVYWVYKDCITAVTAYLSDTAWFGYENVFETEEEAKEFLYGNVTRTEKLELPMWSDVEKFIEQKKHFNHNHSNRVLLRIITKDSIYYLKLCKDLDVFYFELKQTYIGDNLCEQLSNKFPKCLGRATEENYNLARDLCIKLFKGEEV